MFERIRNNPVLVAAAVRAIILAATSFGLKWTIEQVAQLMLAVEAVLAVATRAVVSPTKKNDKPQGPPGPSDDDLTGQRIRVPPKSSPPTSADTMNEFKAQLASNWPYRFGGGGRGLLLCLLLTGCASVGSGMTESDKKAGLVFARCAVALAEACGELDESECPAAKPITDRCDAELERLSQ